MSLLARIKADQVSARKQKLTVVVNLLTTLIGEAEMIGKNAGNRPVSDDEVVALIKKFIKNIDETLKVLGDNNPHALAVMGERTTLEAYLPKQLTEEELKGHINAIHAGILSMKDDVKMGDIMSVLKTRFNGLYDGKLASTLIKTQLESQ
jgi:uncharacterized protein